MVLSKLIITMGLYWFQLLADLSVATAFYTSQTQQSIVRRKHYVATHHKLYGISEWRTKFSSSSSSSSSNNSSQTINSNHDNSIPTNTLPLLLLPFTPSQILIPGQSTTLKFRHGKYMDMIDESLTSYESVVGMSILDEDGLLPYVVVCEVLEEELEVNAGYRGFSSMEVGVKAVGRARRVDVVDVEKPKKQGSSSSADQDSSFQGRKALDDIHLGQFVEWQDAVLDDDGFEKASEYVANIEGLLMLSSGQQPQKLEDASTELDDRIHLQQMLFTRAYETTLEHLADTPSTIISTTYSTNSQRQRHAQLMASSWATLAVAEGGDRARSSSIIMQAIATTDTVKRLRLGLAMMLDSQNSVGETQTYFGNAEENTFQ